MRTSSYCCFVFFLFMADVALTAYGYDLHCQDKKMVWLNTSEKPPPSSECQAFLKSGFSKCYDTLKTASLPQTMTISMPNDQYYSNKESDKYDREIIQDIIQTAVKAGNDPYLILSLVLVENPPFLNNEDSSSYASEYGLIPVDKVGIADVFNCDSQVVQYDAQFKAKTYINKGRLREFTIDPGARPKMICLNRGAAVGDSYQLTLESKPNNDLCCATINVRFAGFVLDYTTSQKIKSFLSNEYIKRRFNSAVINRTKSINEPQKKMAMIAQAYNGYGVFGAREKVQNKCLAGINMGNTPVYGAGVSEIMLNSVMNNSEIKAMVDKAITTTGEQPNSYLCEAYGDGDHKISGYAFTGLLKSYIGPHKKHCPNRTYALKNLASAKVEQVSSPSRGSGKPNSSSGSKKPKAKN